MRTIEKVIEARPVDFQTYGTILRWAEVRHAKPTLSDKSFDWWGRLATLQFPSGMEVGLLKLRKRELCIDQMERHQHTSEIILPVDGKLVIPVSCFDETTKGGISPKGVRAFYLDKNECMILKPRIWHWAPFPLKEETTTVLMWQDGTLKNDVEFRRLDDNSVIFLK